MNVPELDPAAMRERIDELESRLAFQDHAQSELNDALVEQGRRLARLEAQLQRALDDLDKLRPALMANPVDEPPPPHY